MHNFLSSVTLHRTLTGRNTAGRRRSRRGKREVIRDPFGHFPIVNIVHIATPVRNVVRFPVLRMKPKLAEVGFAAQRLKFPTDEVFNASETAL